MRTSTPLPHAQFYVLLALSRGQLHGYALGGRIWNESKNSLDLKAGYLYPLLSRMIAARLIAGSQMAPAGKQQKERLHYKITQFGLVRLQEDLLRLRHAIEIGEAAGLFNDQLPPDIQRLLADLS